MQRLLRRHGIAELVVQRVQLGLEDAQLLLGGGHILSDERLQYHLLLRDRSQAFPAEAVDALLRQYSYFCASKASKSSTCCRPYASRFVLLY